MVALQVSAQRILGLRFATRPHQRRSSAQPSLIVRRNARRRLKFGDRGGSFTDSISQPASMARKSLVLGGSRSINTAVTPEKPSSASIGFVFVLVIFTAGYLLARGFFSARRLSLSSLIP